LCEPVEQRSKVLHGGRGVSGGFSLRGLLGGLLLGVGNAIA